MVSLKLIVLSLAATVYGAPVANDATQAVDQALNHASSQWTQSHSRLVALLERPLDSSHLSNALSTMGAIAADSNSELEKISKACYGGGGSDYTTGPVPGDGSGTGTGGGTGGQCDPAVSACGMRNLFPLRNNAFALVRNALGGLMRPVFNDLTRGVTQISQTVQREGAGSHLANEGHNILNNLQGLVRNTEDVHTLRAERNQLSSALTNLSKALGK